MKLMQQATALSVFRASELYVIELTRVCTLVSSTAVGIGKPGDCCVNVVAVNRMDPSQSLQERSYSSSFSRNGHHCMTL